MDRGRKQGELTLGEKIKEARIAQQLTQSELVGDFITRNMLSKIENDAATPSLKTLEYLAHKLHMPLSYFMSSMVSRPEDLDPAAIDADSAPLRRLEAALAAKGMRDRDAQDQAAVCASFAAAVADPMPLFSVCCSLAEFYLGAETPELRRRAIPYIQLLQARCALLPDASAPDGDGVEADASGADTPDEAEADGADASGADRASRAEADGADASGAGTPDKAEADGADASGADRASQAEALYWDGARRMAEGDAAAAAELFRRCVAARPSDARLRQIYAFLETCSVAAGDYKAAYEYAQRRSTLI